MTEKFLNHFNVTETDISYLWDLFMEHGMTRGEAEHRTKGNHYYLQAICQYQSVEWETWKKNLSIMVTNVIEQQYPQFMVQNKSFEI